MPDLIEVFIQRWKWITGLTLICTVLAAAVALLRPKEYLSSATALPVNSVVSDKAHLFNNNIEALYSDFGSPDELDRIEGTGALDTLYIALANSFHLPDHYMEGSLKNGVYTAAMRLKKNSDVSRSAYGELKVKVWDRDPVMAAKLANALMQSIQSLHQHLQNESNMMVLQKIEEDYALRKQQYTQLADSLSRLSGAEAELATARKKMMLDQLIQYEQMMAQYKLAVNANPRVLLTVENARPALYPDKPKVLSTVLFVLFGSFLFAFVTALFMQTRKPF